VLNMKTISFGWYRFFSSPKKATISEYLAKQFGRWE